MCNWWRHAAALAAGLAVPAVAGIMLHAQGRGAGASPASQPPPKTATAQSYPAAQIEAGRGVFAAQCGFCHGRDAAGGEGGPDLTRSTLVAEDVRGNRITPLLRSGRTDKGMPAFTLSRDDTDAIVAFVHDQQKTAQAQAGGRRSVDEADLRTGDAAAGKRYFESACTTCHSPGGDLAGVATRFQGLALLQRMLYPGSGGGGKVKPPQVTVSLSSGQKVTGALVSRDEFTIAVTDADGWHRSWPIAQVKITVDDPLAAHVEQLGKYTDTDMHDVLAFLQTLR